MPYVLGSPEFARFRTLAAATSSTEPVFLQHLSARLQICIGTGRHTQDIHGTQTYPSHTRKKNIQHARHAQCKNVCTGHTRMYACTGTQMHKCTQVHYPQTRINTHTHTLTPTSRTCMHALHTHQRHPKQNALRTHTPRGHAVRTCGNMQEKPSDMPSQLTMNMCTVHTVHNMQHAMHNVQHAYGAQCTTCRKACTHECTHVCTKARNGHVRTH
jgi:hypothetical protein